jgi:BlaI family transcriptional regulator, penicillinase repressor
MAKKSTTPLELGKRERQIYETVLGLKEASVSEVLSKLDSPPSYSAVRATLNFLVEKSWLKFRQDGQKYLYSAAMGQQKTQRNAMTRMLTTFFHGSATDAVAALLDVSTGELSDEQLQTMIEMIQKARKDNPS